MKNPLLDWVLLIPWLLVTVSPFENPFKSRGASIVRTPQTYYYYDHLITPVSVRQRRQRQFGADQAPPIVVLQTGRDTPATVQIKELPPLVRPRQVPLSSSSFFAPNLPPPPPPPPAPTSPSSTSTTSFARFNQFGQTLFTISPSSASANLAEAAASAAPAVIGNRQKLPENRFEPVFKTAAQSLPQPEAVIGRLPASIQNVATLPSTPKSAPQETPRTLFGGFAVTPSTFSTTLSTLPPSSLASATSATLSQRPTFSTSTTRFLRPSRLNSAVTSSTFQR